MKAVVIYATLSGHSKKIAKAIGKATGLTVINIKNDNIQIDDSVDTIFIVGGIYGGQCMPELVTYVSKLNSQKIKKAYIISSSMTPGASLPEVKTALQNIGIEIAPQEYHCMGGFLLMAFTHPVKDEIIGAIDFVETALL